MTKRQASAGLNLTLGLGLMLTAALSEALAQEPPPAFFMHTAPRPLPEVRFENDQGETMSLADFRGSVVLLNLWATWCAPCRREMPTLDRLQAELGGPDFEVVALSIDRKGLPAVQEFYDELGLETLAIYFDETGEAQRALGVLGLPTTLLLDRAGKDVGRLLGPAEWDSPEMMAFLRDYVNRTASEDGSDRSRHALASDTPQRGGRSHRRNAFLPAAERFHLIGHLEVGP